MYKGVSPAAIGELDLPNGSDTKERAQHHAGETPPADGPSIWIRITRWKRGIPARLGLVAAVAVGAIAFHVPHPLITQPSTRTGWRSFHESVHAWSVDYPASWHAQRIAETYSSMYTLETNGILISNIHHRFDKEPLDGADYTSNFDMSGLPSSLVAVRIVYAYAGGFVIDLCEGTNTPLPLSLSNASRSTKPIGAHRAPQMELYLPFNAHGSNLYSVTANIGSTASIADRETLDQIVASISFMDVPAPFRTPGTTCSNGFPRN